MKSFINKFKYFILGGMVVMAGTVYAVQVSVPSANGSGFLLQSGSNGLYLPVSLTAGSNVTISTTTGNITISSTGGGTFPFTVNSWGNSTTSTLGFLNGFLSTASSTISAPLRLSSLSQGFLFTGSGGLVQPIASSSINLSWFNNDAGFITTDSTASTTLLSDTNYWSGGNIFTNSTTTNFGISNLYAIGSGGIDFHSNNGTPIADFGAGGGAGATFFGGLNVNGTLSFPYSSSTIYSSFITASSTNWLGGGLQTCDPTTGKLTWSGGQFGCGTDQGGGAGLTDNQNIVYVGKWGSDSNSGLTSDKPKLTLNAATSTVASGGLIYVYPGSYNETKVQLPNNVSLIGAEASTTIIYGTPSGSRGVIESQGKNYISNITINDTADARVTFFTAGIKQIVSNSDLTIDNVYVHGAYDGIYVDAINATTTVKNSTITADYDGLGIYGPNSKLFIHGSKILVNGLVGGGGTNVRGIALSDPVPPKAYIENTYIEVTGIKDNTEFGGIWLGRQSTAVAVADGIATTSNVFINVYATSSTMKTRGYFIADQATTSKFYISGGHVDTYGGGQNIDVERSTGSIVLGGIVDFSTASGTISHKTINFGHASGTTLRLSDLSDGCLNITSGLVGSTGIACGSGSGTSAFEIATSSSLALSQVAYISQVSGRTTLSGVATSSLVNGTGITITNGSSAFVLGAQPTFNCNTASASVFGCLAASDFSKFNSATTTFGSGYATTTLGTLTFSTSTLSFNGLTMGMNVVPTAGALTFTPTVTGTLNNSGLTNSTISGVSLGSNLNALTNDATLNGSSYNGSSAISDWGLNLANPNTWTVNQTFNYSSSTIYSSFVNSSTTNARIGILTLSTSTAGTLKVDANGIVWSDTSASGGGYATIQDEGSGLTARTILNFTGSGVSCADDTTKTTCTINSGSASAGGSDTQVQFNDGGALGGAVGWIWNKTKEIMGIGTTTPWTNHKVSIATSTGQNLVLLTGGNDAGVSFRNIGGSLYLSTTSPTTGATSTSPAGLVVDYASGIGKVGVGSTTPWGKLGILQDSYDTPALTIGTSTDSGPYGIQFHVTATSSTLVSNQTNGKRTEVGVRVGVGLWDYEGYGGLLDQFTVNGRINTQDWLSAECDYGGNMSAVPLASDNIFCYGFSFQEDGTGTATLTAPTGGGIQFNRITATGNNDGAGVFVTGPSAGWLTLASSTPVMEVNFRTRNSTATTSGFYIGYTNLAIAGTTYETEPTVGCFFVATSTTNFRAVCKTSNTAATYVDTGVASTSSNAAAGVAYQWRQFRIQADSTKAEFFIKTSESGNLTKVAEISTTYPTTQLLNAGVHTGIVSNNNAYGFDLNRLRFWARDILPSF